MNSLHVSAAAALLLAPTAFADPELPVSAPSFLRTSHGLAIVDGELVGGGPDYSVSFDGTGPHFVPALGREALSTRTLSFSLESIQLGGVELYTKAGSVEPVLAGGYVQYQRGPSIVERYATGTEGLWQSFVFHELPSTAVGGDLVVVGQLTSDLVRGTTGPVGLSFDEPGLGSVTWGGVTGIDADGYTSPGEVRFSGGRIELVLPAEFVASARLPLVLDPLIGTELTVSGGPMRETAPDVAYDFSNDLYLAVWEHASSALDIDIRGQRFDSNGGLLGSTVFVADSNGISQAPSVANVDKSNKFLVAWEQAASVFGPADVRLRAVNASDGNVSVTALRASLATGLTRAPQVASEANPFFQQAFVVWEHLGSGITGRFIDVPPGGAEPTLGPIVVVSTNANDSSPAVSKSGGADGVFAVTMQRYDPSFPTPEHDIMVAVVERTGTLSVGPTSVTNTNVINETAARVDGDGRTFMVVYESEVNEGAGARDVYCTTMAYDSSAGALSIAPSIEAVDVGPEDSSQPEIGFFGLKYFIAWVRAQPNFEADLWAVGVNPSDCKTCELPFLVDDSGAHNGGPRMGPQLAGYFLADDQGFLTWWRGENAPPFDVDVPGQLLEAIGPGGEILNMGGDCGSGGIITASGSAAVGNLTFKVDLTSADFTSNWGWMMFSLNSGTPVSCGTCSAVTPLFSIGRPILGGNASTPLPIPCVPELLGAQFGVQYLVAGNQGSGCPFLLNLSLSDRLAIEIGL